MPRRLVPLLVLSVPALLAWALVSWAYAALWVAGLGVVVFTRRLMR